MDNHLAQIFTWNNVFWSLGTLRLMCNFFSVFSKCNITKTVPSSIYIFFLFYVITKTNVSLMLEINTTWNCRLLRIFSTHYMQHVCYRIPDLPLVQKKNRNERWHHQTRCLIHLKNNGKSKHYAMKNLKSFLKSKVHAKNVRNIELMLPYSRKKGFCFWKKVWTGLNSRQSNN